MVTFCSNTVEPMELLRTAVAAEGKVSVHSSRQESSYLTLVLPLQLGTTIQPYLERGLMVPDPLMAKVVTERLWQQDCITKGWILDGFPMTRAQVDYTTPRPCRFAHAMSLTG